MWNAQHIKLSLKKNMNLLSIYSFNNLARNLLFVQHPEHAISAVSTPLQVHHKHLRIGAQFQVIVTLIVGGGVLCCIYGVISTSLVSHLIKTHFVSLFSWNAYVFGWHHWGIPRYAGRSKYLWRDDTHHLQETQNIFNACRYINE